jgi:hypothetical protein
MFEYFKVIRQSILIRYKYKKQFWLVSDTLKLNRNIMKASNGLSWDDNDYFSKLTIVFIVKNIHRLQSILTLCKRGLAKDALSLLRTTFEELVDYKYISENNGSVKDYSNYDTYLKLKLAKELEKYKDKPYIKKDLLENRIKYLQKEWDKVKNRFEIKKENKVFICKRWNRKDLRETSKLIGLEEVYLYLFKYLSIFAHSTGMSAENYLLGLDSKKNNVVFEVGTSEGFVDEVCLTSSSLVLEFLKIANEKYHLNITEKLDELDSRIGNIKNKRIK